MSTQALVSSFPRALSTRYGGRTMVHHGKLSGWFATLLIVCCLALPVAAANAASVWTDQPDYPPGSTVIISGSGFQAGETVNVLLHETPTLNADILLTPTADPSGNIQTTHIIEAEELGVTYTVTAEGQESHLTATTSFTDAPGPGTAPVNPPTGGFAIDGNVEANVSAVGIGDWVPGAAGAGGYVLTAGGVPIVAGTTFHAIDLYDSGSDNNFAGGHKFDENPNLWTWVSNPVNNKQDLNNGLIHFSTDANGQLWVMVAADRLSPNGDAYIDFEFLQKGLATTGGPTSGGFTSGGTDGGRTLGDFVLTLELTKGGSAPNFFVNRWEAVPVSSQAPDGFDYVDRTSATPVGSVFAEVNHSDVPVSYGAFGSNTYVTNTFAEAAINLTALLGAIDKCTSLGITTLLIKTKESQSPTATIVDFISPISLKKQIGLADAGLDQSQCAPSNTFTVTGVATPAPGDVVTSTSWTVVPGSGTATIASPSNLTTSVTVTSATVTLRFTVNTQQGCTKSDDVVLTVNPAPTCSISGPDGPLCPGTLNQTYSGPAGMDSYAWSISGNGSINGSTTVQDVSVTAGSGCNLSFVLTLTVTKDGCQSTCTKTVEVKDTQAPVLANLPVGGDLGCNPVLPVCSNAVTATDNCGTPPVTCTPGSITGPACARSQTFTYAATDGCGNRAASDVTYTWKEDTTPPVLADLPVGGDRGCNPPLPACSSAVTASDNCDGSRPVSCTPGSITGPACARSQTFTYAATDACGNPASSNVTYTWKEDTTPPVLANLPVGGDLGCNPPLPVCSTAVTASDNCDGSRPVSCTPGSITGPACARSQTFTYAATDRKSVV